MGTTSHSPQWFSAPYLDLLILILWTSRCDTYAGLLTLCCALKYTLHLFLKRRLVWNIFLFHFVAFCQILQPNLVQFNIIRFELKSFNNLKTAYQYQLNCITSEMYLWWYKGYASLIQILNNRHMDIVLSDYHATSQHTPIANSF